MNRDRIIKTNRSALENAPDLLVDAKHSKDAGDAGVDLHFHHEAPGLVSCHLKFRLADGKARWPNLMTEGSDNNTHAAAEMLVQIVTKKLETKGSEWESVAEWIIDGVVAYLKANGMFDDVSKTLESEGLF